MAPAKRKAVAKSAGSLFKRRCAADKSHAEEAEAEETKEEVAEENEAGEEVQEGAEEEQEQENEEEALAHREEETVAARKKELKAMPVGELRDLLTSEGLETGKKEDMAEALAAHEAALRERERARQASIREVVVKKKEELEALSWSELSGLCNAAGTKGKLTKQARVELLMKQWQEDDGVDKALERKARDAREEILVSMDKEALRELCAKRGVDAFVQEVMVDRIVRHENAAGRFARPNPHENADEESAQSTAKSGKASDMVEALLANEANRKKEREQKKHEEDVAASIRKELRGMSIEELKKALAAKGQEATGKKDELVEALFAARVQEEATAAKKAKLKSLGLDELKQRLMGKGLEVSGKKDAMIETLLAHEAKLREEARVWEAKIAEVLERKKEEFEEKTTADLKELCASKGLRLGVGKPERVEALLEGAQASGEVDADISTMAREARRAELLGMGRDGVLRICEAAGVDPLMREVMVERILAREDELGGAGGEDEGDEKHKPAKRARVGQE